MTALRVFFDSLKELKWKIFLTFCDVLNSFLLTFSFTWLLSVNHWAWLCSYMLQHIWALCRHVSGGKQRLSLLDTVGGSTVTIDKMLKLRWVSQETDDCLYRYRQKSQWTELSYMFVIMRQEFFSCDIISLHFCCPPISSLNKTKHTEPSQTSPPFLIEFVSLRFLLNMI